MSEYRAPLGDIGFLLREVFDFDRQARVYGFAFDSEQALAIAEEAAKFAKERLARRHGTADPSAARRDSFSDTKSAFCDARLHGFQVSPQYWEWGLSAVAATVVDEIWHGARPGLACSSMSTRCAAEVLSMVGNDTLKRTYLTKLVSGVWTGDMSLVEPVAGSNLSAIRCKALQHADGVYRLTGQKVVVTHGERALTENAIHLVLARTPDAPKGVRGISLFAVPEFLVHADGAAGLRNDVHGISAGDEPGTDGRRTAVISFGEQGGAIGYLVGEPYRALEYVSIFLAEERFAISVKGLAMSVRAYQQALAHATAHARGRGAIISRPGASRILLSMKSRIDAMRALAIHVAMQKDMAGSAAADHQARRQARSRSELLAAVLYGWVTECENEISQDAIRVCGRIMPESGAARYCCDIHIVATDGATDAIGAFDLLGRTLLHDQGEAALSLIDTILSDIRPLTPQDHPAGGPLSEHLIAALVALRNSVQRFLKPRQGRTSDSVDGAIPCVELWGLVCGGWMHLLRLRAAQRDGASPRRLAATVLSASHFAHQMLIRAPLLVPTVRVAGSLSALTDADWEEWAW